MNVAELQDYIQSTPEPETESSWGGYRSDLREHLLKEDDWSDFRKWPIVCKSLYTGAERPEFQEERRLLGRIWSNLLESFDPMNGTAIRQAFSLSLYEEVTGIDPRKLSRIIEFGGGYGEMAYILYLSGFVGEYIMYDFPELIALQKWYLQSKRADMEKFVWIDSPYQLVTREWNQMPELGISICSLSETEIPLRQVYVGTVVPDSVLIRYQKKWLGVDNDTWFSEYVDQTYEHIALAEAPKFGAHEYAIGRWVAQNED